MVDVLKPDYEAEDRKFAALAKKNRAKFALPGESFATNFLLGLDYATNEEALQAYQSQYPDQKVRFDDEHIVDGFGKIHNGVSYADYNSVTFNSIQRGVRGVSVYIKPKRP